MAADSSGLSHIDTTPINLTHPIFSQPFFNVKLNLPVLDRFCGLIPLEVDSQFVLFTVFEHIDHIGHLIRSGLLVVQLQLKRFDEEDACLDVDWHYLGQIYVLLLGFALLKEVDDYLQIFGWFDLFSDDVALHI